MEVKKWLLLLLCLGCCSVATAQQGSAADTSLVLAVLQQGTTLADKGKLDSAEWHFLQADSLSRSIGYRRGLAQAIRQRLKVMAEEGRYKEGLALSLEAVEVSRKLSREELSIAYNNAGRMSWLVGKLQDASAYYVKALEIAKTTRHRYHQMWFCNNLASVFKDLHDVEKCHEYASQSYQLALQLRDSAGISSSLINIAFAEISKKQFQNATQHLEESLQLANKINRLDFVLLAYVHLGLAEMEQENHPNALGYFQQGLQLVHYFSSPINEVYLYGGLAKTYYQLELYSEAEYYLQKAVSLGTAGNNLVQLHEFYKLGALIYEELDNLTTALEYRKKYQNLSDSLLNAETQQNIHRLEIEYQTSQKEKEIAQQHLLIARNNLELERKNNLIYLSAASLIALLSMLVIFYMLFRNRQKTNHERLMMLERENELKVLMASISGEEKERSRLARELHDGVGGTLSATKMHLSVLRNEKELGPHLHKFNQAFSLLDTASREVRSIAHNLSPDLLIKYELEQALENYCKSVSSELLKLDFYALGDPLKLKLNIRFIIYRIVQELINNIIKHAQATHALVQISYHDQVLFLTVEDNGQGFDSSKSSGMGLLNLQNRIKELNGHLHLESVPGKGTTINIELNVAHFIIESNAPTTLIQ